MAAGQPRGGDAKAVASLVDSDSSRPLPASSLGAVGVGWLLGRLLLRRCLPVFVREVWGAQEVFEYPLWVLTRLHRGFADGVVGELRKDMPDLLH